MAGQDLGLKKNLIITRLGIVGVGLPSLVGLFRGVRLLRRKEGGGTPLLLPQKVRRLDGYWLEWRDETP